MLDVRPMWIDLERPTDAERAEAEAKLGARIPSRETLREIELSSRVHSENAVLFLNAPHFQDASARGPLGFVLSAELLVTQHGGHHRFVPDLQRDLERTPARSSTDVFLRALERIVDDSADALESIEAEAAETAERVFHEQASERRLKPTLRRVGELGSQMARTHNALLDLDRIATHLRDNPAAWFDEDAKRRLETIQGDLRSLLVFEEQLGDRVQFLLDGVLGQINIDQNEIMKVMTVASVVGVPPTVLVGVWGMNFRNMPELEWHFGYFLALATVFASAAIPLLWFRRKGWI